ncbi:MAG: hypothetical protein J3Q66DRAFT_333523 [Benniella sp.]|nr:MAG: hypothetical protein J3Q66DRAFT_333523 [Benniella sp.]
MRVLSCLLGMATQTKKESRELLFFLLFYFSPPPFSLPPLLLPLLLNPHPHPTWSHHSPIHPPPSPLTMQPTAFVQLPTALYEWNKECPKDLVKDLEAFFQSPEFLDRPNVFFKGVEDSSNKWVALISVQGAESTRSMLYERFQFNFLALHASQNTTFSQVTPAPRMPVHAAYNKFIKDVIKANKANRAKEKVAGWSRELQRAAEMVFSAPGMLTASDSGTFVSSSSSSSSSSATATTNTTNTSSSSTAASTSSKTSIPIRGNPWSNSTTLTALERSASSTGMWFISVDIESYERDHSKILEIGWTIWDSQVNKFMDSHYAISDYRHLANGKYVADRRDRFTFGQTVWASLQDAIAAFQQILDTAAERNAEGAFVLIAHDMSSDEAYLRQMGIEFPKAMIKFDTLNLNVARTGDRNKTGLGRLLDELDIENYCLHNAGNDAHYTMELFMYLTRNHANQKLLEAEA